MNDSSTSQEVIERLNQLKDMLKNAKSHEYIGLHTGDVMAKINQYNLRSVSDYPLAIQLINRLIRKCKKEHLASWYSLPRLISKG